jgi:hypothetical protein
MLDFVACSLPTIDAKLDVILSNFSKPHKIALVQDVEAFHVAGWGHKH